MAHAQIQKVMADDAASAAQRDLDARPHSKSADLQLLTLSCLFLFFFLIFFPFL
eukprot:27009_3